MYIRTHLPHTHIYIPFIHTYINTRTYTPVHMRIGHNWDCVTPSPLSYLWDIQSRGKTQIGRAGRILIHYHIKTSGCREGVGGDCTDVQGGGGGLTPETSRDRLDFMRRVDPSTSVWRLEVEQEVIFPDLPRLKPPKVQSLYYPLFRLGVSIVH